MLFRLHFLLYCIFVSYNQFLFFSCILYYVARAFVKCLIKYLLTYLLRIITLSESSWERIGQGPIGRFAPGSELARERKGGELQTHTSQRAVTPCVCVGGRQNCAIVTQPLVISERFRD